MGKWCFFAWSKYQQARGKYELVQWAMLQSGKLEAETIAAHKVINAWAESKSTRAVELRYSHKSARSAESDDCIDVETGYVEVSDKELTTTCLVSCCAIAFTFEGKNFLAHITSRSDAWLIGDIIIQKFDVHKLRKDPNFFIVMWSGMQRYNEYALQVVKSTMSFLELDHKLINATALDGIDEYSNVGVNIRGTFSQQILPRSWKSATATIVRQDTAIVSANELLTDRLLGFSAVAFTDGAKNFLALVDNGTRLATLQSTIANNFDVSKLKDNKNLVIVVWNTKPKNNAPEFAKRTIIAALKKLGLASKLIDKSDELSTYSEVGVNVTDGAFSETVTIQQRNNFSRPRAVMTI